MAMPPHFYAAAKDVPFFHYTSLDGAIGMLTSRTIWMSDFACMNDPQEYHYARAAFLEAYHARTRYIDLAPRLHLTTSLLSLEANTRMFIACVSPTNDDPHQWERYGDGGRGCVIELDAEFLEQRAGIAIRQVVYSRRDFERVVDAGLRMMQSQYEAAPNDHEELEYLAKSFVSDFYAFKHPDFAPEQEIRLSRLIVGQGDSLEDIGGYQSDETPVPALPILRRNGATGITPYIALPLRRAHDDAIRSVIVGSNFPGDFSPEMQRLRMAAGDIQIRRLED